VQVEEIEIPLVSGTLDGLADGPDGALDDESERPESSVAVDSLDTANAAAIYAHEAEIEIDFSGLDAELCELSRAEDISDVDKQFKEKLVGMATQLDSMRPNLSAGKKLAGISDKLVESNLAFTEVQAESKRIAAKFAKVQQERTTLFLEAFEHVKDNIGSIYKLLTTSKKNKVQQGGTAFLGMENTEEPYVTCPLPISSVIFVALILLQVS
jgi:structural maintenance of chromosome 1